MIIRSILLALGVLVFLLLGFDVITQDIYRWQEVAFAFGFAAFFPWPR